VKPGLPGRYVVAHVIVKSAIVRGVLFSVQFVSFAQLSERAWKYARHSSGLHREVYVSTFVAILPSVGLVAMWKILLDTSDSNGEYE
jgi:hypothetical protein